MYVVFADFSLIEALKVGISAALTNEEYTADKENNH